MHSFHKELDTLLQPLTKILITSHRSPDPDAISSLIAMGMILDQKYPDKHITLAFEGPQLNVCSYLPHYETVQWVPRMYDVAAKHDIVIVTDASEPKRFTTEPELFTSSFKPIVYIDHHPFPTNEYTLLYDDPDAAATCQVLVELFLEKNSALTKELCFILLNGIIADTGGMRFVRKRNARVLQVIERLVSISDVSLESIELKLSAIPVKTLPILEQLIHNMQIVTIPPYPSITYSFLPRTSIKQYAPDLIEAAWEYFKFNYLRRLENSPWGFAVKPKTADTFGISFRSTDEGPIVLPLAQHFGGGGHPQAAACEFKVPSGRENMQSEGVCQLVLDAIKAIDPNTIWDSKQS